MPRTREGRLVSPPRPSARLMSPTRSVRMKYTVAQPSPSSPSSSPATTGTRRGLGSPSRAVRTLGSPSRAARTLGSPARSTRGRGGAASSLAPAPLRRTLGKLQRCRAINDLHEDVQSRRLCGLWIGAIEAEARAEAARLRSSAAGAVSWMYADQLLQQLEVGRLDRPFNFRQVPPNPLQRLPASLAVPLANRRQQQQQGSAGAAVSLSSPPSSSRRLGSPARGGTGARPAFGRMSSPARRLASPPAGALRGGGRGAGPRYRPQGRRGDVGGAMRPAELQLIKHTARWVARHGADLENVVRVKNANRHSYRFLWEPNTVAGELYRQLVAAEHALLLEKQLARAARAAFAAAAAASTATPSAPASTEGAATAAGERLPGRLEPTGLATGETRGASPAGAVAGQAAESTDANVAVDQFLASMSKLLPPGSVPPPTSTRSTVRRHRTQFFPGPRPLADVGCGVAPWRAEGRTRSCFRRLPSASRKSVPGCVTGDLAL
jgi:hypothetical protein